MVVYFRNKASGQDAGFPTFDRVELHREPLRGGIASEAEWMVRCTGNGRAQAHLWQAPCGLVVPRRYTLLPGWAAAASDEHGELQVRASGGGLVPQGPGVWNLSLVRPRAAAAGDTTAVYRALCERLSAGLASLSLAATPQAVEGSFCDGRYNVAINGRKLAGTAQAWRVVDGKPLVLAHAAIVIDADPHELTARANAFERALGRPTRYRADALTSIAIETADRDIGRRALEAIAERVLELPRPSFTGASC